MAILDLSHLHMYRFYYDVLKPIYGERIKLAYTDTDSFVIHFETEDLYKDFQHMNSHMDFLTIQNIIATTITNEKFLQKIKDEMNGNIITEFIALKPKLYAFQVEGQKEQKQQNVFRRK